MLVQSKNRPDLREIVICNSNSNSKDYRKQCNSNSNIIDILGKKNNSNSNRQILLCNSNCSPHKKILKRSLADVGMAQ